MMLKFNKAMPTKEEIRISNNSVTQALKPAGIYVIDCFDKKSLFFAKLLKLINDKIA